MITKIQAQLLFVYGFSSYLGRTPIEGKDYFASDFADTNETEQEIVDKGIARAKEIESGVKISANGKESVKDANK